MLSLYAMKLCTILEHQEGAFYTYEIMIMFTGCLSSLIDCEYTTYNKYDDNILSAIKITILKHQGPVDSSEYCVGSGCLWNAEPKINIMNDNISYVR